MPSRVTEEKPLNRSQMRNKIKRCLDKSYILNFSIHLNPVKTGLKSKIKATIEIYVNESEYIAELLTNDGISIQDEINTVMQNFACTDYEFIIKYK